jgi:hypothetical protein
VRHHPGGPGRLKGAGAGGEGGYFRRQWIFLVPRLSVPQLLAECDGVLFYDVEKVV